MQGGGEDGGRRRRVLGWLVWGLREDCGLELEVNVSGRVLLILGGHDLIVRASRGSLVVVSFYL